MSDGSLSQDEIDALLQGTDTIEMDTGAGPASSPLSDAERASFQEMLRGVTESQGSNLSILTGKTVAIGDPTVRVQAPGGDHRRTTGGRGGCPGRSHRRSAGRALLHRAGEHRGDHRGAHDGPARRRAGRGVAFRRRGGVFADHGYGGHGHRQPGRQDGEDGASRPSPGQAAAGPRAAGRLLRHGGLPILHRGIPACNPH